MEKLYCAIEYTKKDVPMTIFALAMSFSEAFEELGKHEKERYVKRVFGPCKSEEELRDDISAECK